MPPGVRPGERDTEEKDKRDRQQGFTFGDSRSIYFLDVQTGEAILVIKHASKILDGILQYYRSLFETPDFPNEISQNCAEEMAQFEAHINGVQMDLQMQASRLETLQHSISEGKTLVSDQPRPVLSHR